MNCNDVRERMSLYLYGELSGGEERQLVEHVAGCPGCRRLLEQEKALHRTLDSAAVAPPAEMLESCRRELRPALRTAGSRRGLRRIWALPAAIGWLRPAGAVALLAIGFLTARLTDLGHPATVGDAPAVATRVRSVEPAPDGAVSLVVEETRQNRVRGTLDDPAIRNLLVGAVMDPADPAVRMDSLDVLKQRSELPEVRDALLVAAETDPNEAVRFTALEALRPYVDDPRSRQVLSRVLLRDQSEALRAVAMDMLTESPGPEVVGVLQDLLTTEDEGYLRERSQQVLRTMNASLETF
jgi:hypothetical protein